MAKIKGNTKARNNRGIFILIALLVIAAFIGTLTLLNNLRKTEGYWVLNQDVGARMVITPSMVEQRFTSEGTAPQNAITLETLNANRVSGGTFAKYPLMAGDVLSQSNTALKDEVDIRRGVPEDWVITSFPVSADDAVGGRIREGMYFDMMINNFNDMGAVYPFVNVRVLDTSVSLNSASSNEAVDTAEADQGQTEQYFVAMSPEDAGKLQHVVATRGSDIRLVMSPVKNAEGVSKRDLRSYDAAYSYNGPENPEGYQGGSELKDMSEELIEGSESSDDGEDANENEPQENVSEPAETTEPAQPTPELVEEPAEQPVEEAPVQ